MKTGVNGTAHVVRNGDLLLWNGDLLIGFLFNLPGIRDPEDLLGQPSHEGYGTVHRREAWNGNGGGLVHGLPVMDLGPEGDWNRRMSS